MPTSVTLVSPRITALSWGNPRRYPSPASVTSVLLRSSIWTARQPLEVDESGVCDLRAAQFQALQLAKSSEMHQPGVRNSAVEEPQRLEASQPLDLYQASVRHRAILRGHVHKEMSEAGQLSDATHYSVGLVASLYVHGFCEQVVSEQSAEPSWPRRRRRVF